MDKPRFKDELNPETPTQREVRAIFSEADKEAAKALVAGMKEPGVVFIGKHRVQISVARAKRLFGENQ